MVVEHLALLRRGRARARPLGLGVSGMSMYVMPSGRRASTTALTIAGVHAIVAASPTPLTPSVLLGEGVSVRAVSNTGTSAALGRA